MSHTVTVKATEIKNLEALQKACTRLKLPAPVQGRHKLFEDHHEGYAVALPQWNYPAVVDIATGQVYFDNFNGEWGQEIELDKLVQAYVLENGALAARRQGYTVTETPLTDGVVRQEMVLYT